MVFNLLPIPPTDGGRIATSLLPPRLGYALSRVEPYGLVIIIILMLTGIIWRLLDIVTQTVMQVIGFLLWIKYLKGAKPFKVGDNLKLFLIIFSLVLLFVIGSAAMMRYFDGKSVKKKGKDK